MVLISVSDLFSTTFWFILAIVAFILLFPIFMVIFDFLDSFFFIILDCIIYLPKGWNEIINNNKALFATLLSMLK